MCGAVHAPVQSCHGAPYGTKHPSRWWGDPRPLLNPRDAMNVFKNLLLDRAEDRRLVFLLGLCQIMSWGSTYYSFTVLVGPMRAEMGWSLEQVTTPFSAALVVAALVSPLFGKRMDTVGSKGLMVLGYALAAIAFVLWSRVSSYLAYWMAWLLMALAMKGVLLQPVFALLVKRLGPQAKKAVTSLTLFTAVSASIFVPFSERIISAFGWRTALLILGSLHVLCLAIVVWAVPQGVQCAGNTTPGKRVGWNRSVLTAAARNPRVWGVVALMSLSGFISTALAVHLIPLLTAKGYAVQTVASAFALSGAVQVALRIALIHFDKRYSIRALGIVSGLTQLGATIALWLCANDNVALLVLFMALWGATGSLSLIVGALATAEFLGTDGYATVQGAMALPISIVRAAAPSVLAFVSMLGASHEVLPPVLCAVAAVAAIAYMSLARVRLADKPVEAAT
ncbi:MFS transporter [Verminephrobacter aporrectodeae subsp. tuberculatae]|nr:MFS transporter [Verminephrobacter aporrectodeae subsp. tuberculatae]